jgi:hypothetical protein
LLVVGGFSVMVVAGSIWGVRDRASPGQFADATYIAIAGHLFLIFVAGREDLSTPPWPMFAILGVLDLAIAVGALYLRRARLMTAAIVASQIVLAIWTPHAKMGSWPDVALVATIAVAALAVCWFALDRRFTESAVLGLFAAQFVVIVTTFSSSLPRFASLLAANAVIVVTILAITWLTELHAVAVVAAITTALIAIPAASPSHRFIFALVPYALFIAYPLLLGARAKRAIEPYLAAVIASAWFFLVARRAMIDAKLDHIIGVLPVAEAAVMMLVLLRLLRLERVLSRLALVAGAALMFITVAIPLQLDKQWITIGWALEGAALIWLFTRIPHRGLLLWGSGLLAAVFVRLTLNQAVLHYHAPSNVPILNWYLYTYLVCAAAMFIAAYYFSRDVPYAMAALSSAGTILLFLLVNIEIADFFSRGRALTFNFFSSSLAEDLTYTIGWALFAITMLIAGLLLRTRPVRVAALILLLLTILKCFLHDLGRLGGLYRVGSLLGLAISLVATGILLQRFVMMRPEGEKP